MRHGVDWRSPESEWNSYGEQTEQRLCQARRPAAAGREPHRVTRLHTIWTSTVATAPGVGAAAEGNLVERCDLRQPLLLLNPTVCTRLEQIERQNAAVEHLVVEAADVEPLAQLLVGALAQLAEFELAELVGQGLRGPGNITVGLRLQSGLIDRAGLAEEVHHLLTRPALRVDAGIHYETHRAEQLAR